MPPTNRRELDSKRLCARLIDGVVIAIPAIALVVTGRNADLSLALLVAAVQLSYFFILEATVGQTLGKQLMGLKVVRADGAPAGIAAVSARTVLRLLEDNLLGLIVMVLSGKRRQRIGDFLGGTIVARAADVPALPAPSPLVVVYPMVWIVSAFAFPALSPEPDRYLSEMAAICKARTDIQDRMPKPLDVRVALAMSAEETRRIAALRPSRGHRRWHRLVVDEKQQFDRLGRQLMAAVAKSPDPESTFYEYEGRLEAEAREHNALFAAAGLTDCAR